MGTHWTNGELIGHVIIIVGYIVIVLHLARGGHLAAP
jgi:hypothetical protein